MGFRRPFVFTDYDCIKGECSQLEVLMLLKTLGIQIRKENLRCLERLADESDRK